MQGTLKQWATEVDLAILNQRDSNTFDCRGRLIGRLRRLTKVAVSLDAQSVASVQSSDPARISEGGEMVAVMDLTGAIRHLRIDRLGSKLLAIASTGTVAVAISQWSADRALLVIPAGGEAEDVLPIAKVLPSGMIESLAFSCDGSLLAVGSRESFVVLELTRRRTIFNAVGRFPRISPSGKGVSYLEKGGRLVFRDLATSRADYPCGRRTVRGIGSWSPDGRYLLVGMPVGILANQLRILDIASGRTVDLVRMDEGIYGTTFAWVKRSLIDVVEAPRK